MKPTSFPALRLAVALIGRAVPIGSAAPTILILAVFCTLGGAQQSLNNDAVIKLVQGGLSDDLIMSAINASPGLYDASADGLIALKSAGVSDKVIAAIVVKSAAPPKVAPVASSDAAPTPRYAAPPMPLGLCEFRVYGSSKSGNAAAMVGVLAGLPAGAVVGASGHHGGYYHDINKEAQQAYETTFGENVRYRVVSSDKLLGSEGKKSLSMAETAQGNDLYACVSAKPSWAGQRGKDIRAVVTTNWEVVRPGGCKVKFMTSASSRETYRKLPNGADPAMNSVYLGLSKQDARKFLEDLLWEMKKAGCSQDR